MRRDSGPPTASSVEHQCTVGVHRDPLVCLHGHRAMRTDVLLWSCGCGRVVYESGVCTFVHVLQQHLLSRTRCGCNEKADRRTRACNSYCCFARFFQRRSCLPNVCRAFEHFAVVTCFFANEFSILLGCHAANFAVFALTSLPERVVRALPTCGLFVA